MVEVFKTNVGGQGAASLLLIRLQQQLPGARINFDLQDCDRILRVEGNGLVPEEVIRLVEEEGFFCKALE